MTVIIEDDRHVLTAFTIKYDNNYNVDNDNTSLRLQMMVTWMHPVIAGEGWNNSLFLHVYNFVVIPFVESLLVHYLQCPQYQI